MSSGMETLSETIISIHASAKEATVTGILQSLVI